MALEGRLDGAACAEEAATTEAIQCLFCRKSTASHHLVILEENPVWCGLTLSRRNGGWMGLWLARLRQHAFVPVDVSHRAEGTER